MKQSNYYIIILIIGIACWFLAGSVAYLKFDLTSIHPSKIHYILIGCLIIGIGMIIDAFLVLLFASEDFKLAW